MCNIQYTEIFCSKKKIRVSREVTIYPLSPVYPREIFRPVGSSVSFAVRIIGDYKPENIKWYKGLTKVDLDRTDIMVSDDGRNLTVLNLKKSDYGSYICTLKDEETQETRAKTDFQLSQPVFDHYGDIAHYWDFEMMQHREESHVEFLDTISHKKSTGTCARSSEGLVGNSLYLNMKRKRCNGFFTLYKDTYADECLTEPDNCIDGLSLSLWLNPNSATGDDFVYLVCGEPRGLCLKGKYNEAKGHFTISVSLTTTERRWKVDGLRIVIEEWQNIVVSWDPIGEMRVYLNSELKGSQFAEEKAQPRVAGEQHIAYLGKGPGEEKDISYINGLYDELVIWYQRVISAKETSTMFLQVRGMGPYPEDESTYEFEIAEGESATFHCPYQIPLLFRSHLNWVRDDHILPELRGRSDVRVIGDTMLSMTCQYFSGARLVISDPFKIKFPGVPEEEKSIHELTSDMTEEVKEEEEDKHNEMILQFQKNEQPAGVEQQDVLRELPCASYPCLNGGTCENQEVKYKLGENTVIDYLYKCLCTDEYIGENCQNDVDECDDATLNDCSPFAVCQNSEGSYQCQCQTGYHGDGKQCIAQKVTIKLANPDICDHYMEKVHRCIIITHQLHQCGIEIDMDITGKYRTDQIVWMKHIAKLNRTSSKSTKFKDEEVEFMVSEDGKQKQFSCEESDFAENYFTVEVQNGQFPTPKFTFKIIHKSIDINECELETDDCDEHAECENTPAAYICLCHTGYEGSGKKCEDLDECSVFNLNNCDRHAECINTPGSYECHCKEGYKGDGNHCVEIDCPELGEFENGRVSGASHSFYDNAVFTCYNGYRLSGSKALTCLQTGQWSAQLPVCEDINECEVNNYCDPRAICSNLPGTFECRCQTGYLGDGTHCADIDECQSSNPCHHHARCTNVDGGFTCTCYHSAAMTTEDSTCGEYGGYRNESMMRKQAKIGMMGMELPIKELEPPVNLNISKMEYNKTLMMELETKKTGKLVL
ncbi:uncharacterized protein [Ptychodera flava]|uniref:uncharacterized protein n=1 Tax=Ptychodera flava TaxID=63121 RepID=UPI00396A9E7C